MVIKASLWYLRRLCGVRSRAGEMEKKTNRHQMNQSCGRSTGFFVLFLLKKFRHIQMDGRRKGHGAKKAGTNHGKIEGIKSIGTTPFT